MVNRAVSRELYEQYMDATAALFMECYALTRLERAEREDLSRIQFPPALDANCRKLIRRQCLRQRAKDTLKGIGKGLGAVACLVIVLLSLSSVLFISVEAVRDSVINYYIEQKDGYWEISGEGASYETLDSDKIDLSDPLRGLIPEEYIFVESYYTKNYLSATYDLPADKKLHFIIEEPTSNVVKIDSEGAEISKKCRILGYDALLVVEDGHVSLTWFHEESMFLYGIEADGLDKTEVIAIAKQIIRRLLA